MFKRTSHPKITVFAAFTGLLVLLGLLAAGCDDDGGAPSDGGLERVSMTMGWLANGTFAPAFLAQEKGFFAEEGLDVDVRQGGPGVGVELLAQGQFDFSVATVDDAPLGIPQGLDIKVVAVLAHKSPASVVVLGDSDIQSPKDLEGRTIAVTAGDVTALLLPTFLEAAGVDPDQVTETNVDPDLRLTALLTGQVDAAEMFLTDEWLDAKAEDPDARAFPYSEYGINHITTGILTRNELLTEKPEVVRGFVRAILRGYAYAADHPEEAIAAAAQTYPENFEDADVSAAQLQEFVKLMETPETEANGLGYSTAEEWDNFVGILEQQGLLEEGDVRPVEEYFTNDFLPEEPVQLP